MSIFERIHPRGFNILKKATAPEPVQIPGLSAKRAKNPKKGRVGKASEILKLQQEAKETKPDKGEDE